MTQDSSIAARVLSTCLATALVGLVRLAAADPEATAAEMPRIPATPPEKAAATFAISPGFHAELVASEPLLFDPVAISFDERGRAYVVEMRDYSERRPERLGRVRLLEDTDHDGVFDKSTVFLDSLPWPTAVTCYAGGVLIGTTPDILFARDENGDGVADTRETILTGFASGYAPYETNRLNVQALMNSFHWTLDNRIHGSASMSGGEIRLVDSPFVRGWIENQGPHAASGESARARVPQPAPRAPTARPALNLRGRDFSIDPRNLELRAEPGGGQHGMSFDDWGRKFVCSNSDHLQQILYDDWRAAANPYHNLPPVRVSIAADGPAAEVFRRSPDEPWRIIRTQWRVTGLVPGMIEGGGRPSGYFTGATGASIYRGDAFGPPHEGDAFIADCGSNLVHRKRLRTSDDGIQLVGERPGNEQKTEFLASTDNWFRPVQFASAPDGCLWILDMYREIIEHPWSLPPGIKKHLDLNSGNDRGRLWRIAPDNLDRAQLRSRSAGLGASRPSTEALIGLLAHPNGWHRDTASRLLCEHPDTNAIPSLRRLLGFGGPRLPASSPASTHEVLAKLHAWHVLASWSALSVPDWVDGLRAPDAALRTQVARSLGATGPGWTNSPAIKAALIAAIPREGNAACRLEFALLAGHLDPVERVGVLAVLFRSPSALVRSIAIHGAGESDGRLWNKILLGHPPSPSALPWLGELAQSIGRRGDASAVSAVISTALTAQKSSPSFPLLASLVDGLETGNHPLGAIAPPDLARQVRTATLPLVTRPADSVPAADLRAAVTILASLRDKELDQTLLHQLTSTHAELRKAVTSLLGRRPDWLSAATLRASWPKHPSGRSELAEAWLRRPESTKLLLETARRGEIDLTGLQPAQLAALRESRNPEIKALAQQVVGPPPPDRLTVIGEFLPALNLHGNADHGRTLYRERCATCHRLKGEGQALGPDLESVASQGPNKLLVNILDPNREVQPAFAAWTAETTDGETVSGLLTSESESAYTLKLAGGQESVLPRSRVSRLSNTGRSLMPEGLEAGLKPQDLADLMAALVQATGK